MNDACPLCRHYEALRERAKQTGDYSKATHYEVIRRRHPTHIVHIPRQPGKRPA